MAKLQRETTETVEELLATGNYMVQVDAAKYVGVSTGGISRLMARGGFKPIFGRQETRNVNLWHISDVKLAKKARETRTAEKEQYNKNRDKQRKRASLARKKQIEKRKGRSKPVSREQLQAIEVGVEKARQNLLGHGLTSKMVDYLFEKSDARSTQEKGKNVKNETE